MISPQQIAYILAVYETGSISRAAEQCFVTQPTLSMQLKKAEELLGHLIFHRDTNSMELTDFGKSLMPLLQQIQGDFGAIDRICQIYSGTYRERLRIGVIPTVAAYLLLDNFREWQILLPNTQVSVEELKTEELIEALDQTFLLQTLGDVLWRIAQFELVDHTDAHQILDLHLNRQRAAAGYAGTAHRG